MISASVEIRRFRLFQPPAILLLGKPGMEVPLLNGITRTILKEGLENKGFIDERTEGIEALRKKVTDLGNRSD